MKPRLPQLSRASACALVLASVHASSSNWALPAEHLPKTGKACFVGDAYCRNDAFNVAAALHEAKDFRYVVTGRIVKVDGLPDTLGESTDVDVTFELDSVRKPPGQCPVPPRIATKTLCERKDSLPPVLRLRIPSDWFLWPGTGTSRLVARRAGAHLAGLRDLERKRASLRLSEREYTDAKARLEQLVRNELDSDATRTRSSRPVTERVKPKPRPIRLLEDRRVHIEVGGEYLFALGDGPEGDVGIYHLPPPPALDGDGDWRVLQGAEMRDVETAMMLIGNCMQRHSPRLCMVVSRGLATFWLYDDLLRRH